MSQNFRLFLSPIKFIRSKLPFLLARVTGVNISHRSPVGRLAFPTSPVDGRRVVVADDGEHGHPGELSLQQGGDGAGRGAHLLPRDAPAVVRRVVARPHDVLHVL